MEKAFELQKKARDNTNTLQTYLTDLQNWETEMKRKEAALNGDFEQNLPPVRSKARKEQATKIKKKPEQKISASDYQAWEKFDADRACENIDMEDVGPVSLDSSKSQQAKLEKLKEEGLYEKERGNTFVKQEKWDEAIACYNRAIELVKDDAIYYANRGLCYLKKDSLHQAESDCTEALKLDSTYVKALQRRATARERLGSLRAASNDLIEVIKLEPHNAAARRQLEAIKARMGTKGTKSKSSPLNTPTLETKSFTTTSKTIVQPKVVEIKDEPVKKIETQLPTPLDNWKNGVGENITVIKPVKKPPHLRSKRSLKSIKIKEIPFGETLENRPTQIKITEIEDSGQGDTNNNDSKMIQDKNITEIKLKNGYEKFISSPESEKLVTDNVLLEKDVNAKNLVPPVNSVQFMAEWKYLKGKTGARCDYLTIIDPAKIPSIFENALESDVLSDVLHILHENTDKFREKTIKAYLKALCKVKRFSALAMFLSSKDKKMLAYLLDHCKNVENCSDEEISDLKNKYEL